MKKTQLFRTVLSAMLLALALVLPFLTGQLQQLGNMLCPMHIPVLLCGFFCGPVYGMLTGLVAPVLRFFIFGMPQLFPTGIAMSFELAAYGLVSGLLYNILPKKKINIYISLISAMLAGRSVWGLVRLIMLVSGNTQFSAQIFFTEAFVNAVPGIILQIVVIPLLVIILSKETGNRKSISSIKKSDVISFFDSQAESWDSRQKRNEKIIEKILDNGGIKEGISVLDIACGTGVLFPDYIKRGVKSITAIDISPEMVRIAREKYPEADIICADAEEYNFGRTFDAVMVYNAFPHFSSPERLIENLAAVTRQGGRISICHSMSREALCRHHSGKAKNVSFRLPDCNKTAKMLEEYFDVDIIISDDEMYQIAGIRK